jgi:hypothetical protein
MTLEEAIAKIEDKFVCIDGPAEAFDPNGEPYIVSALRTRSGSIYNHNTFINYWLENFLDYIKDKKGILYWRIRPEIAECRGKIVLYSRFSISLPKVKTISKLTKKSVLSLLQHREAVSASAAAETAFHALQPL